MLILHVYIRIMILSCSYLGHSGDTVLVSNLQLETKSERKYWEIITNGISLKILSKESSVENTG